MYIRKGIYLPLPLPFQCSSLVYPKHGRTFIWQNFPQYISSSFFFLENYFYDFKLLKRTTISFTNVLEFSNITSSQCAKLCVEQEGAACRSFAYCNMTSLCRLTSSHPFQSGNTVSKSDTCDLYSSKVLLMKLVVRALHFCNLEWLIVVIKKPLLSFIYYWALLSSVMSYMRKMNSTW